mgnify:CR=1 FL=1
MENSNFSQISFVKVFGERNTGTNFLNQLINQNTDLSVLNHGDNKIPKKRLNQIYKHYSFLDKDSPMLRADKKAASLVLDRLVDQQRKDEYLQNFGWKHALVDVENLKVSPRFNETLFVFLIRNPWRFVSALHRRPHNLFPLQKGSLDDFVDSSFLANERDRMPCNFVQSPVEFWNIKVESYFNSQSVLRNSFVVYYEDVMESPGHFLKSLAPYCDVSETLSIPMKSTKGDDKSFDDYQKETAMYDPLSELGETVYFKILGKLNKETLKKTPYMPS